MLCFGVFSSGKAGVDDVEVLLRMIAKALTHY